MSDAPSYAAPVAIGAVMVGATVARVEASRHPDYRPGELVLGQFNPEFLKQMSIWFGEGKIKVREGLVDGLENAPAAFIGMLQGRNFGKLLVRIPRA